MKNDFSALQNMVYSGRGITIGMTPDASPFIGYTLTGRSPPSQARELVYDEKHQIIRTSVTDKKQLEKGNPALLIYPAMALVDGRLIASNGAQTKLIYSAIKNGSGKEYNKLLVKALTQSLFEYDKKEGWIDITSYEPDAPNFTPRISACLEDKYVTTFLVSPLLTQKCGYQLYPGKGKLITTYKGGNESPLAPFDNETLEVGIKSNTAEEIVEDLYEAIGKPNPKDDNKVYRVSAAVMMLKEGKLEVAVRNRSEIGN